MISHIYESYMLIVQFQISYTLPKKSKIYRPQKMKDKYIFQFINTLHNYVTIPLLFSNVLSTCFLVLWIFRIPKWQQYEESYYLLVAIAALYIILGYSFSRFLTWKSYCLPATYLSTFTQIVIVNIYWLASSNSR